MWRLLVWRRCEESVDTRCRVGLAPPDTSPGDVGLLLAEIGGLNLRVHEERRGGIGEDDFARLNDISAVGKLQRCRRVLLNEQDGQSFLVQAADRSEDLLDENRGDPH